MIEQPDSEKPRDVWSDPRTTPPGRTATNWEDNQLWQGATRAREMQVRREEEINLAVSLHLVKLYQELKEDFNMTDEDILQHILMATPYQTIKEARSKCGRLD